jgi:hypothetical protein
MKKKSFILSLLTMTLVFGSVLMGCDTGTGGTGANEVPEAIKSLPSFESARRNNLAITEPDVHLAPKCNQSQPLIYQITAIYGYSQRYDNF